MIVQPVHPACLMLTATIRVKDDVVFTARKNTEERFNDYRNALRFWLSQASVASLVFVENSGFDLSELVDLAKQFAGKRVEFLSFTAPAFDGALGKGYGEMLCLEHALEHSILLAQAQHIVKVTGRYTLANADRFLTLVKQQSHADILCDLLLNLTWADSRIFAATPEFLRTCLFPLKQELNDSRQSNFEHVLARAVHACMANRGTWIEPPFPLEIQGVSGSQGRAWQMSLKEKYKLRLRHMLFVRFLKTGPR